MQYLKDKQEGNNTKITYLEGNILQKIKACNLKDMSSQIDLSYKLW